MHVLTRKTALLIAIAAVSAAAISIVASEFIGRPSYASENMAEIDEYAVDRVTIYGNGITYVICKDAARIGEENRTIRLHLPSGALIDTLMINGINVAKITTSQEYHPIIAKGDLLTVYTKDEVFTGIFLGWNDMLMLEVSNKTVMIPGDEITKIILQEVVQIEGPKTIVEVTTNSPPGEYEITISYLMRGPKWRPTYFIDLETSYLECWATIENVETWKNFTLILVSGGPHIVYKGPIFTPYMRYSESLRSPTPSIEFTSSTTDEYHEYTYNARLSFEKGTIVKLPLFNGTVSLRQEYYWSGSGEVKNRYYINNTLNEPLAAGIAEFYRGDKWVGEDEIPYTPVNGKCIAIVNYAYDIKVTRKIVKSIEEYRHTVRGIEITIRNHKNVDIQILVEQNINGYTLVTSSPPATRVGPILSWVIKIKANSKETIYYEWEHYW